MAEEDYDKVIPPPLDRTTTTTTGTVFVSSSPPRLTFRGWLVSVLRSIERWHPEGLDQGAKKCGNE